MSQEPVTIRYELEDVLKEMTRQFNTGLEKIEQKMDKQYGELNQKIEKLDEKFDGLQKDVNDVKIGQARLEEKVTGEIKTLDAKVDGITKRLDFQEFINRGVVLGLIATILGGAAKMFGWIGN